MNSYQLHAIEKRMEDALENGTNPFLAVLGKEEFARCAARGLKVVNARTVEVVSEVVRQALTESVFAHGAPLDSEDQPIHFGDVVIDGCGCIGRVRSIEVYPNYPPLLHVSMSPATGVSDEYVAEAREVTVVTARAKEAYVD